MGSSKFITVPQAAAILGVGRASIYRYVKRGIMRAKVEGRSMYIVEEDLLMAKKGRRDVLSSPLKRDIIGQLLAEIQTLKSQMATVMRILNVHYDPLKLTPPEYERFYQSAIQLSTEGWAPHSEEVWADNFVRLSVDDLEAIEKVTGDGHPWRPILRLATTMHLNPYNKTLTDLFAAGRNNVQQVSGVWCVLKEESPRTFDLLQQRDATPLKKLLKRLQKAQN